MTEQQQTQPPTQLSSEPNPSPVPRSPLKITYGDINVGNINQLSLLNHCSLPVKYSTGFYHEIVTKYNQYSKFVYYNDIIIGAYTVRTEPFEEKNMAYILTFIVLEKYRKLKIGSDMILEMERSLRESKDKEEGEGKEKEKGKGKDKGKEKEKPGKEKEKENEKVEGIYLHVHVMNESAITFYKKQGFVEHKRLENYYKTIEQPHALVLIKMFV